MSKKEEMLKEFKLNLMGKLFFASAGAWLIGKLTNIKIRGSAEEVRAVANAMLASKRFQEELNKPGASVESVVAKLNLKHASAKEFERILGVPWPL